MAPQYGGLFPLKNSKRVELNLCFCLRKKQKWEKKEANFEVDIQLKFIITYLLDKKQILFSVTFPCNFLGEK